MSKTIIVFFTENGSPKTGLTPTIDVWEDDATHAVNAQNMTEIAGGFYKYVFATYDSSKNIAIRADGGAGLPVNERYHVATNDANTDNILKVETNKLLIGGNQLKIFDDDDTTVLYTWNLLDQNGQPNEVNVFRRNPV